MVMIMNFCVMAGMVMIMWAVFPGVFMIVRLWVALVEMIMCMGVRVLVAVLHITV
ncbi:MAG: hypothetical protein JRI95_16965 [Deltaproteobacteria bacterium]|nr:hypothetical protein [Deltaproteobacteria bacterium]